MIDDARIELLDLFIADPYPLGDARAEVVHEDVGALGGVLLCALKS